MIKGVHHVAIHVPDFEAGLRFYTEVLGMEVQFRSVLDGHNERADRAVGLTGVRAEFAMLKAWNLHVELWQYANPEPENRISRPCDYGYPHLALEIEDIESEYARLTAAGMQFVGPPVDLGRGAAAVYGEDPFGNIIELYEPGES